MATVSPKTIFDYLVNHHGVSVASAAGILANIEAESGFKTVNPGDGGTSDGLFQHHAGRLTNLKRYGLHHTGRSDGWTDWRIQVDFAMMEAEQMNLNLQHTSAYEAAHEWTIKFERPSNASAKAKARANAASQYMYGQTSPGTPPVGDPVTTGSLSHVGPGGQGAGSPLRLPKGGSFLKVGGDFIVAYRFHGQRGGPTGVVYYQINRSQVPKGAKIGTVSPQKLAEWRASGWQDGGSVDALRGIPKGKTYQQLVDDVLMELGLSGTGALQDAQVMNIIAIAMAREMSSQELANRLRKTNWWNERTDKQREWNDLSNAERSQRIVDRAMNLGQLYFTYVGVDLKLDQYDRNRDGRITAAEIKRSNPELYKWAQNIESGKRTEAQAVNNWLKAEARNNPNSPWSRTLREEEQAQGQHEVDIETAAENIIDMYWEWGMPITDRKARRMGEEVAMNRMSMADVEDDVRDKANGIYKNKPQNMPTRQWAQPYLSMYSTTLETPEVDLSDKKVQRALKQGMTLTDFRQMLRNDDRWLETDNARTEFNESIGQLGRIMGF